MRKIKSGLNFGRADKKKSEAIICAEFNCNDNEEEEISQR